MPEDENRGRLKYCTTAFSFMVIGPDGVCPNIKPKPLKPCLTCRHRPGNKGRREGHKTRGFFIKRTKV